MKLKKSTFMSLGGISAVVIIGIFLFATMTDVPYEPKTQIVLKENPSIDIHNTEKELTEEEIHAIEFVQKYNGSDNQGISISEFLGQMISSKYSDDLIYDSETKLGWSAYTAPDNPGFHGVIFEFKSNVDEFSFIWYVNSKDNMIYSVGGGSEEILNIVNSS